MANSEHLAILHQGVQGWNAWRARNPEARPDLSHAALAGAYLSGANLSSAEVIETSIREDPYHRSAAPIDILHLNKDGARWVQKKKECGEIQPYTNK